LSLKNLGLSSCVMLPRLMIIKVYSPAVEPIEPRIIKLRHASSLDDHKGLLTFS